ncbi:hypothetical protein [Pseudomonas paraeruginosa]|uniref:hypothetical protein n=1 Tax=Pseudomonas paraeruginosa TaxID=2994495 RepID=UPI0039FCBCD3
MNDRELLELAAKAACYQVEWVRNSGCHYRCEEDIGRERWCPLDDDGDALRLAVKLRTSIFLASNNTACESVGDDYWFDDGIDAAAARRAIVNAAARIGRAMP